MPPHFSPRWRLDAGKDAKRSPRWRLIGGMDAAAAFATMALTGGMDAAAASGTMPLPPRISSSVADRHSHNTEPTARPVGTTVTRCCEWRSAERDNITRVHHGDSTPARVGVRGVWPGDGDGQTCKTRRGPRRLTATRRGTPPAPRPRRGPLDCVSTRCITVTLFSSGRNETYRGVAAWMPLVHRY